MALKTISQLPDATNINLNVDVIPIVSDGITQKTALSSVFALVDLNATDTGVRALTSNWESTYTTFKDVSSTFLTSETDSQTLSFDENTKDISISNGNTISLSALIDANGTDTGVRALTSNWESTYTSYSANSASFVTPAFTDSKYLPLTGGTVTGLISSTNSVYIDGSVEIGTGPATLFATTQSVGINTETPNEALTVVGNISATGNIYGVNSDAWRVEDFIITCGDEVSELVVSESTVTFRAPFAMYVDSIRASVNAAPVGCGIIINVKRPASILLPRITIDEGTESSFDAAVPSVVFDPYLLDDVKITISVDQVGSTFAGRGLKLVFKGYRV